MPEPCAALRWRLSPYRWIQAQGYPDWGVRAMGRQFSVEPTIPAPTVSLVVSSIRMKLPVRRFTR
jgi:hypothetical protein